MNKVFTAKLLQNLRNKKSNKGFTLIELLVVVIIIGVLAAIALPNLLAQVGKARESEAKTALGALNRSQQAYRIETQVFFDGVDYSSSLGVIPGEEFYAISNSTAAGSSAEGTFTADATDPANDGTRDFAAGVEYDATTGKFGSTLCVATAKDSSGGTAVVTADPNATGTGTCTGGSVIK
jgi:prepilin-type N-terminal cleavage/methylation domain-containing protein